MGTPTARAAVQRTGLGWTKKLTGQTKGALRVERPHLEVFAFDSMIFPWYNKLKKNKGDTNSTTQEKIKPAIILTTPTIHKTPI